MLLYMILYVSIFSLTEAANYTGHKVFSITPQSEKHVEFLHSLKNHPSVDFWKGPHLGVPILATIKPELVRPLERILKNLDINYNIPHHDLQSLIDKEKFENIPSNFSISETFDFTVYNKYESIMLLITELTAKYPKLIKDEIIGRTFENHPIHSVKISSGNSRNKEAVIIECGLHAKEWSSVAVCAYLVDQLVENYGIAVNVTSLLDKYEINVVLVANPDGYMYSWTNDRMWRKSRSRSQKDSSGLCRGTDLNRNFDYNYYGGDASNDPCNSNFRGDEAFSESEARALRDLMSSRGNITLAYISIHSYLQLWLTPYGDKDDFPKNYKELERVAKAGIEALHSVYQTEYKFGTITRTLYEVSGCSVDYAFVKRKIPYSYAIEIRDTGVHGHVLPQKEIFPMCVETYQGLVAALSAI